MDPWAQILIAILSTLSTGLAGWALSSVVKLKTYVAVVDTRSEARHEEYERRFTEQRKDTLDLRREHIAGNKAIQTSIEGLHEKMAALQQDLNVVKVTCARVGHGSNSDHGKV